MKTTRATGRTSRERVVKAANEYVENIAQMNLLAERNKQLKAEFEAFAQSNESAFDAKNHCDLGSVILKWGQEGKITTPNKFDALAFANAYPDCVKISLALSGINKILTDGDKRKAFMKWKVDVTKEDKLKIELSKAA